MTYLPYTGIGSRILPAETWRLMIETSAWLEHLGFTLRSGGALGSDTAFERGLTTPRNAEIFLPAPGFNGHKSQRCEPPIKAFRIAERFHPAWHRCGRFAQKCHARNVQQIMGESLDSLTTFVVCWTPGGRDVGGTAQSLRIARTYNIPIFNLADPDQSDRLRIHVDSLIKHIGCPNE